MSNREKILWTIFAGVLVLLYLLSSTDLIIKEEEKEIHTISVIIPDANDEYYVNFRKGMDNAAEKLHADVNFITLYEANDMDEQMELFQRELKDGADAIIIEPVNEDELLLRMTDMNVTCPVVLLGESMDDSAVRAAVHVDKKAAGVMLAEQMVTQAETDLSVMVFTEGTGFSGNQDVYEGIKQVLDKQGFQYQLVEREHEDSLAQALESMAASHYGKVAILALDTASLDEAADLAEGKPEYQNCIGGIYGVDSTIGILRKMDRDIINGIVVHNQYDEGYISVHFAIEAIQDPTYTNKVDLESYDINKEVLRDPQYEKLLYPIE